MRNIVILTGAGISAESGLRTFRDSGGLWEDHDVTKVATPEAFERDPDLVHRFYSDRRNYAAKVEPNAAHIALARLQNEHRGRVTLVTQNVDNLHERGGSSEVIHMHGELFRALCAGCGHRWDAPVEMRTTDPCPSCSLPRTRPDVVWFGEMPYHMDEIHERLEEADLFAAIGTSGTVYPAAFFVVDAARSGARTIEMNLEAGENASAFDEVVNGPATEIVPDWVECLLKKARGD